MVFVTVGSQKFQFDRLVRAVDELAAAGALDGPVFAQTGWCAYEPRFIEHVPFLDRDAFRERMAAADVVVTHAGTGAIVGALKAGKKVVAVPRLRECGEHVDDHQREIVERFAGMGLIEPCMDVGGLADACRRARGRSYRPYRSNTERFVADLRGYLESVRAGELHD